MLIVSAEARWFHDGEIPDSILNWFCQGDDWIQEPPRVDRYLKLAGCATVGVKLREGRFEIKARRTVPRSLALSDNVNGLTDGWIKWSSASPDLSLSADSVYSREPREWLPVHKERWLRWLDVGNKKHTAHEVELPALGCTAELTSVTVGGASWWTFAVEAMGNETQVADLLTTSGRLWFASHPVPQSLEEINAASYPVWLARHHREFGDRGTD